MALIHVNLSQNQIKELLAYFDCFVYQQRDPDMQGFLVRASAFIVNICLAVLIKWSKGDLISPVGIVFLQVYTIMLATFITMGNNDMSIPDAHFALVLTISPLSVYFVYATAQFLFRRQTLLYRRLSRPYHMVVTISTLMMLSLWIAMQFVMYFAGDDVFGDDDGKPQCIHPSFVSWFLYRLVEYNIYLNWAIFVIPAFLAMFVVYALRHVVDIWREAKYRRSLVSKWRFARFIQIPWTFCTSIVVSVWTVVTRSHPWFIFFAITVIYLAWAGAIGLPSTSMASFYWIILTSLRQSVGQEATTRPDDPSANDIFSYGQLLAGAATFEPLYRVLKLAWKRRRDLGVYIKRLPRWMWNGVLYFFAGRENPWEGVLRQRKAVESSKDTELYESMDVQDEEQEGDGGVQESGPVGKSLLVKHEDAHSSSAVRVFNLQSVIELAEEQTRKGPV